ncbi:recombinase [candidate division KSB1 bacterium]|nr:recombinase [candidate division KSB1 bacterium]MBL7093894.1 recombinase [candidate division KSB1 bacterium]
MSLDYEKYEKECEKIRKSNEKLLNQFEDWLAKKEIKQTTINKHAENIDFYINDFLLYEDTYKPEDGVLDANMFLGYWFIRKAMWASESSIKSNASSLKKFYTFMCEMGRVDEEDVEELKIIIKENMSEWLNRLRRYDNPDITEMEDVWKF